MRQEVSSSHPGAVHTSERSGRDAVDYAQYLLADTFAVFLFHGVVLEHRWRVRNYIRKHIDQAEFRWILERLLARGTAVSLADIVAATVESRALPPQSFVITFDDGFANNYAVAAPILAELNVPATFFVTTNFVDRNAASWTDMVEWGLEKVPRVQVALTMYGLTGVYERSADKIALMTKIRNMIFRDVSIDPYQFAAEFLEHIQAGTFDPDPDLDQKMTWDQVHDLAQNPLFSIGGHSHTHAILSYLGEAALAEELDTSLALLQQHVGQGVNLYSYPQGLDFCYSDSVIAALKARGIVCCPTAEEGVNRLGDDLFRLKRIMVT